MMKIATETAIAQMANVKITFEMRGAKMPKLKKMTTSHAVMADKTGIVIDVCSDLRNSNQYVFLKLTVTLAVQFASLPDGTNYVQRTVLDATAKNLVVTTTNSSYSPLGAH